MSRRWPFSSSGCTGCPMRHSFIPRRLMNVLTFAAVLTLETARGPRPMEWSPSETPDDKQIRWEPEESLKAESGAGFVGATGTDRAFARRGAAYWERSTAVRENMERARAWTPGTDPLAEEPSQAPPKEQLVRERALGQAKAMLDLACLFLPKKITNECIPLCQYE